MIIKIIGPIVTLALATITGAAAWKTWGLAYHAPGIPHSWVLAWGSFVLAAISVLIIVGAYLSMKPKLVGLHGVKIEEPADEVTE